MALLETKIGNGNGSAYLYGGLIPILFERESRGAYPVDSIQPWFPLVSGFIGYDINQIANSFLYAYSASQPIYIVVYSVPNYIILGKDNYSSGNDLSLFGKNITGALIHPIQTLGTINNVELDYYITGIEGWALTDSKIELNTVIVDNSGTEHVISYEVPDTLNGINFLHDFSPAVVTIPTTVPITNPSYMYFYIRLNSPSNFHLVQIVFNINVTLRLLP